MPCNCDHLEPKHLEKEISKMLAIRDMLKSDDPSFLNERHYSGYHPEAYGKEKSWSKERRDDLIAHICTELKEIERDDYICDLALEAQLWWRDHKRADAERERRERQLEDKRKKEIDVLRETVVRQSKQKEEMLHTIDELRKEIEKLKFFLSPMVPFDSITSNEENDTTTPPPFRPRKFSDNGTE